MSNTAVTKIARAPCCHGEVAVYCTESEQICEQMTNRMRLKSENFLIIFFLCAVSATWCGGVLQVDVKFEHISFKNSGHKKSQVKSDFRVQTEVI